MGYIANIIIHYPTISFGCVWKLGIPQNQWPLQDPKLEVPTIYKAYFSGLCKGISPENMAKNMVQYLQFRILEFPLTKWTLLSWEISHVKPHGQKRSPIDIQLDPIFPAWDDKNMLSDY